jgi:hypothetical protein
MPVMTVTLDWLPTGFTDRVFKGCDRLLLGGRRTGHVENLFFQDRSVKVVYSITE